MWNPLRKQPAYPVPDQATIQKINQETKYTDDAWWLEQFTYQWLFVFDDFMSVHKGDLEGAKMGIAYTKRDYILWKKDMGEDSYPIALRSMVPHNTPSWADPKPGDGYKIKGELWLIRPQVLKGLDKFKENRHVFQRKRITVVVPSHELTFETGQNYPFSPSLQELQVWSYIGVPELWKPLIAHTPGYRATRLYKPNNKLLLPYYFFSQQELNEEQDDQ